MNAAKDGAKTILGGIHKISKLDTVSEIAYGVSFPIAFIAVASLLATKNTESAHVATMVTGNLLAMTLSTGFVIDGCKKLNEWLGDKNNATNDNVASTSEEHASLPSPSPKM